MYVIIIKCEERGFDGVCKCFEGMNSAMFMLADLIKV